MPNRLRAIPIAATGFVAACGGGDDPTAALQAQYAEFEAQAIALAPDSPCSADAQCSHLTLARVAGEGCMVLSWQPQAAARGAVRREPLRSVIP